MTHLIVNVPAGADVTSTLHGRWASYPNWNVSDPRVLETARYFDTANFASGIAARSLVGMGFIDDVSAPAGVWSVFNQIKGPKEVLPMPDSPHNHLATAAQQRPITKRTAEWLDAIVHGRDPHAAGSAASAPRVVFFDDFAGDSLDRSKWTARITGQTVNEEQQAYVDDTATIRVVKGPLAGGADGALLIRGRWRPGHRTPEGNRFDFVSGRMDSRGKVEFTYGTAACAMANVI